MAKFIKGNGLWIVIVVTLTAYFAYALLGGAEEAVMPGESTHGHYQIELACSECHTKTMGVKQDNSI